MLFKFETENQVKKGLLLWRFLFFQKKQQSVKSSKIHIDEYAVVNMFPKYHHHGQSHYQTCMASDRAKPSVPVHQPR